jgi:uncharacterized protein (DUF1697 family)
VAFVVFLRGVNVGGYRTFRPAAVARQLKHLGAINIGAAGTFVIRAATSPTQLRTEIARRLPFEAEVVICADREIRRLVSRNHFAGHRDRRDIVRFVSVLSRLPRSAPSAPLCIPSSGGWLVKILRRERRFVIGLYRRQMKVISCLSSLDRIYQARAVTRNWNTIVAIAKVLEGE